MQHYEYDSLDELTRALSSSADQRFTYDKAHNLTSNSALGSYAYGAVNGTTPPHAPISAGNLSFTYDANGNRISKQGAGTSETITFDADNRPSSITENGVSVAFKYGPDGARLSKSVAGQVTTYLGADRELSSLGVWTKNIHADVKRVGNGASSGNFYHHRGDWRSSATGYLIHIQIAERSKGSFRMGRTIFGMCSPRTS